jgi:hypothetical protein
MAPVQSYLARWREEQSLIPWLGRRQAIALLQNAYFLSSTFNSMLGWQRWPGFLRSPQSTTSPERSDEWIPPQYRRLVDLVFGHDLRVTAASRSAAAARLRRPVTFIEDASGCYDNMTVAHFYQMAVAYIREMAVVCLDRVARCALGRSRMEWRSHRALFDLRQQFRTPRLAEISSQECRVPAQEPLAGSVTCTAPPAAA